MAKYVGLLTADARGKLGGVTFTRSAGVGTLRRNNAPTNRSSRSQQNSRQMIASVAYAWRGLTFAQQLAWNVLAGLTSWSNVLGQAYAPTGQQLFSSCQLNLLSCGLPMQLTALTALPLIPAITGVVAFYSSSTNYGVYVEATSDGSPFYQQMYAANNRQQRYSRPRVNLYRNMGAVVLTTSFVSLVAPYLATFGVAAAPLVYVAARVVDSGSGFATARVYAALTS